MKIISRTLLRNCSLLIQWKFAGQASLVLCYIDSEKVIGSDDDALFEDATHMPAFIPQPRARRMQRHTCILLEAYFLSNSCRQTTEKYICFDYSVISYI